jgi:hypothetical protein
MEVIERQQPKITHMAPVCGPWSQLQNLNDPLIFIKSGKSIVQWLSSVPESLCSKLKTEGIS